MATINQSNDIAAYSDAANRSASATDAARYPFRTQQGSFQGERVVLIPNETLKGLQANPANNVDNLEEITFAAPKAPTRLNTRAANRGKRPRVSDRNARISKIKELVDGYIKKLPLIERQMRLKEVMKYLDNLDNLDQLQASLTNYSEEVSERYLALSLAREALAERPEKRGTLTLVEQALAELADKQGRAIVLGVRITGPAQEAARGGAGSEQDLRVYYCKNVVQDYQGLSCAWRDIHSRFGDGALDKVISFMIKALGADLDSQQPLFDRVKLTLLIKDMNTLQQLRTFSERVDELWKRVKEGEGYGIRAF